MHIPSTRLETWYVLPKTPPYSHPPTLSFSPKTTHLSTITLIVLHFYFLMTGLPRPLDMSH